MDRPAEIRDADVTRSALQPPLDLDEWAMPDRACPSPRTDGRRPDITEETDVLQCTALTDVPEVEALVALITMEGAPRNPPDALYPDDFLLCELAEHDERTEHAAHFWTPEPPSGRELWMLWTGSGTDRVRRFVETAPCPAILRHLITGEVEACALYVQHPATHSWDVTDPLGDLVAERAQKGAQRILGREDPDSL